MATTTVNVAVNTSQAIQNLNKLNKQVESLGSAFSKLGNIVGGLAIGSMITNLLRSADAMDDLAKATGFTIAEINGLGSALAANGANADDAAQVITKFSDVLTDARNGSTSAIKAFRQLGIPLNDLAKDDKVVFRETIKRLGEMAPSAQRTALQMQFLSKAAREADLSGVNNQLDGFIEKSKKAEPGIQNAANLFNNLQQVGKQFGTELTKGFSGPIGLLEKLTQNTQAIAEALATLTKIVLAVSAAFLIFGKGLKGIRDLNALILVSVFRSDGAFKTLGFTLKNLQTILINVAGLFKNLLGIFAINKLLQAIAGWLGFGKAIGDLLNKSVGLLAFYNLLQNIVKILFRLSAPILVIYALAEAVDYLFKKFAGFSIIDAAIEKVKEFAGLLFYMDSNAFKDINEDIEQTIDDLQEVESAAAATRDRLAEIRKEQEKFLESVKEVTANYTKQNKERVDGLSNEIRYLTMSNDAIELDKNRVEITKQMRDAVEALQKKRQEALESEINNQPQILAAIDAEIAKVKQNANVTISETEKKIKAIQEFKNAQDVLIKQNELQKIQMEDDANIKALQDQIALIQLYGDELENANIALEVTQSLEQSLLEFRKQELDLIARKGQLTDEQFQRELAQIEALRQAAYQRAGAEIDARTQVKEAQRVADEDANLGIQKYIDELEKSVSPAKRALESVQSVFGNMENALNTFVTTGKFKFKDFALSVIQDLLLIQAKAALVSVFKGVLKGLGIFGFAEGGSPPVGKVSLVGEKGPELFVPRQAGTIIPNDQLTSKAKGTGMVNAPVTNNYITNNINALDAKSVAQLFAENRKTLLGVTETARREMAYGM